MIRPFLPALLFASVAMPSLAASQAMVQAVPGTTDADRLAGEMRLLAGNPNDINALLAAGELSLKLDDLGAAASFFARAEKVDPRNGRAKAGQAAILVHAERPGEALRYFATAESYGLPAAAFASDRGLAYDLIGEQDRAQRDYRLALRSAAPDDETLRRYALSLGISGKRDLAEQELQPLLRKQDRGAWRARAFVEAMTGNVGEADHIATTMMPPGTAAGLQPFFARLATLGAIDRAFAVHFGEVRGTAQRVADARLAPAMAALGPDPYAPRPVALAAAAPVAVKDKRKGRKGKQPVEVVVAAAAPEPPPQVPAYGTRVAAATPPPAVRGVAPAAWPTAVAPTRSAGVSAPPVTVAATTPRPSPVIAASSGFVPITISRPSAAAERDVRVAAEPSVSVPAASTSAAVLPPAIRFTSAPPVVFLAPAAGAAATGEIAGRSAPAAWPTTINPASPPPSETAHAAPAPVTVATAEPRAAAPASIAHSRPPRGDALASIVGGLPIPAAELGIAGPHRAEPAPAAEPRPAPSEAEEAAAAHAAAAKALADRKAADRKAAAEKKALADKKAAAAQKAEEAREAAAQKKLERANPERIWVQVAGGAYEGDLPKAWAAAKKKGGDLFAGHATGWTTPLRFTNRVLAGPFKTDDEARAFVNKLKTKGMSGFTFTSDAGQVVKKLGSDE